MTIKFIEDTAAQAAAFALTSKFMGFACGATGGAFAGAAYHVASTLTHAVALRILNQNPNTKSALVDGLSAYAGFQAMKLSLSAAGYQIGLNVTAGLAAKTALVYLGVCLGGALGIGGALAAATILFEQLRSRNTAQAQPVYQ